MSTPIGVGDQTATPMEMPAAATRGEWIGADLAHLGERAPARTVVPLLSLALLVALGVAALRIDLIRTRYALAEAMAEERRLIEEQRTLTVDLRRLRDPAVLAGLGHARGFVPAADVRSVTDPMPPVHAPRPLQHTALPAVAAGPPGGPAIEVAP
jgi:hypothetical protein